MSAEINLREVIHKPLTVESRASVADVMTLIDTYADTACVNGIRSGWAVMARTSVQQALVNAHRISQPALDNCQRCYGERGGIKGNEVRIRGEMLCDYCHADIKSHPNG